MQEIAYDLEVKHGYNALQCIYGLKRDELTADELMILKEAQRKRIELSDAIYVVDIGGYIGNATREEMQYAQKMGKEIIMHSSCSVQRERCKE